MGILSLFNRNALLAVGVVLGLASGIWGPPIIFKGADIVSELFIRLLQLVSLPIIFLSIISTATGMESMIELKIMGKKVAKYTVLTTIIAASVALGLFLLINPVGTAQAAADVVLPTNDQGYLFYLIQVVPSNFLQPFVENNVISVLFLAIFLSVAILALPKENQQVMHSFFKSLYAAVMKMTTWIIKLMPIAIWAFITLFFQQFSESEGEEFRNIAYYLAVVVFANLVQAFVVLPLLLQYKGINPLKAMKAMFPALSVAFFSKSSSAALPMAMKCAEDNMKISPKVAGFSLPLCTTINMNGCAAFILSTVLFVSMSNGMTFTPAELGVWILVATIAAIGNAGVPMGCYFLSSAILVSMGVPLTLLGIILPFYSLIDMLESAINVWSDSCVTAIVQKEVDAEGLVSPLEGAQIAAN